MRDYYCTIIVLLSATLMSFTEFEPLSTEFSCNFQICSRLRKSQKACVLTLKLELVSYIPGKCSDPHQWREYKVTWRNEHSSSATSQLLLLNNYELDYDWHVPSLGFHICQSKILMLWVGIVAQQVNLLRTTSHMSASSSPDYFHPSPC